MKLTKAQKLEAYRYALNLIEEAHSTGHTICPYLGLWCENNFIRMFYAGSEYHKDYPDKVNIPFDFPEFLEFRPQGIPPDQRWWPMTGMGKAARIEVLQKCILKLENLPDDQPEV